LNEARKPLRLSMEKSHSSRDSLYEIEQTIAELEIYLETNSDDEIALVQYQQFLNKREDFTFFLTEAYEKSSQSVMQA
jgi:hypothetical protein